MPPRKKIQGMFGAIAHRYDFLNHLLSLNVDRLWRRRAVRRAGELRGKRVLDVCSGTGDLAFAFHRAGARVVGADFCREMIEVAARKAGARDGETRFLLADTLELPFPSETFDVASVAFGIRNVEDIQSGLREMMRVLVPGGQLLVLEFSRPPGKILRSLYYLYFKYLLPRIGALFARRGGDAYRYLPRSVMGFPDPSTLSRHLLEAGAGEVRFEFLSLGIATLHVGIKSGGESSSERGGES